MLSRREEIDEFFLIALNLDAESRRSFLESVTPDQREEVQTLLAAYEGPRFPPGDSKGRVYDFGLSS
jgi:hypothetical protein